jgi:group I intron endonuclease
MSPCEGDVDNGVFNLNIMKICTYSITHLPSGRQYIGSTKDYKMRIGVHRGELRHNKHYSTILQEDYNKDGFYSIEYKLIKLFDTREEAYEHEQCLLDTLKPFYNVALFATSPAKGLIKTEETKNKLSLSLSKNKGGAVYQYDLNGNFIIGYESCAVASLETDIYKGTIVSASNNYAKSAGGFQWRRYKTDNIGKWEVKDDEETKFLRGKPRRGKPIHENLKQAIIERNKNFVWSEELRKEVGKRNSKPVNQYDLNTDEFLARYDSVLDASRKTELTPDQIRGQLNGKTKVILYYRWEWANH